MFVKIPHRVRTKDMMQIMYKSPVFSLSGIQTQMPYCSFGGVVLEGETWLVVAPHVADHIGEGKKIVKLLMVLNVLFKDSKVQIHY